MTPVKSFLNQTTHLKVMIKNQNTCTHVKILAASDMESDSAIHGTSPVQVKTGLV